MCCAFDECLAFLFEFSAENYFGVDVGKYFAGDETGQLGDGGDADIEFASFACNCCENVGSFFECVFAEHAWCFFKDDGDDWLVVEFFGGDFFVVVEYFVC